MGFVNTWLGIVGDFLHERLGPKNEASKGFAALTVTSSLPEPENIPEPPREAREARETREEAGLSPSIGFSHYGVDAAGRVARRVQVIPGREPHNGELVYLDVEGRVGIRTSTPSAMFNVVGQGETPIGVVTGIERTENGILADVLLGGTLFEPVTVERKPVKEERKKEIKPKKPKKSEEPYDRFKKIRGGKD